MLLPGHGGGGKLPVLVQRPEDAQGVIHLSCNQQKTTSIACVE